jgi:hypothetical protein
MRTLPGFGKFSGLLNPSIAEGYGLATTKYRKGKTLVEIGLNAGSYIYHGYSRICQCSIAK